MKNKFDKDLNFTEFLSQTGYTRSSFYDRLNDMYGENGVYKIPQYKFKKIGRELGEREDIKKGDNDFLFKKEWVDLAVVLTRMYKNNPMYSKSSSYKRMNFDKFQSFNEYCLNEIENLNEPHKSNVKNHPIYIAMLQEKILLERVQRQMYVLFTYLSEAPIESRAFALQLLDLKISGLLIESKAKELLTYAQIKKDSGSFKELLYGEYKHSFIDLYIAELLNNEMDGKHAEIRKDLQDRVLMILGYDSSQLSEDEKRQNRELAEWIIDREFNERIEGIKKSVKNTPNIRKIAENYLSEVDQYNEKQKMAIMDFVAHMESYYEVYDKVISDQKDTVDNLFAATNANILNRNNN